MVKTQTYSGDVFDNLVLISVDTEQFGRFRKADKTKITTGADIARIGATKRLGDSSEMQAVCAKFREVGCYMRTKTFPLSDVLKSGVYGCPVARVKDVHTRLVGFQSELEPLLADLKAAWADIISADQVALGDQFRASDYPTADEAAESYVIKWRWLDIKAPTVLATVDPAVFAEAKAQVESLASETVEAIRGMQVRALSEILSRLTEKMTGRAKGVDASEKIFRNSVLTEALDFFSEFEAMNVTNFGELSRLAAKAKAIVKGADPDLLRDEEQVKAQFVQAVDAIVEQLDVMLIPVGKRRLAFRRRTAA